MGVLKKIKSRIARRLRVGVRTGSTFGHTNSIYWDTEFADILERWGQEHVWPEIQAVLAGRQGRVLDIACGTGSTILQLDNFLGLRLYGCDLSDLLIQRAVHNLAIDKRQAFSGPRLVVCDATKLPFVDRSFEYSYSIGSLEHFSEDGIGRFLEETWRVTSICSFHQIPISRNSDQGWISPYQSYHNNTENWWMPKFKSVFQDVYTLPSGWSDARSVGKWFVCLRDNPETLMESLPRIKPD